MKKKNKNPIAKTEKQKRQEQMQKEIKEFKNNVKKKSAFIDDLASKHGLLELPKVKKQCYNGGT